MTGIDGQLFCGVTGRNCSRFPTTCIEAGAIWLRRGYRCSSCAHCSFRSCSVVAACTTATMPRCPTRPLTAPARSRTRATSSTHRVMQLAISPRLSARAASSAIRCGRCRTSNALRERWRARARRSIAMTSPTSARSISMRVSIVWRALRAMQLLAARSDVMPRTGRASTPPG